MFCSKCGVKVEKDFNYCKNCGEPIKENNTLPVQEVDHPIRAVVNNSKQKNSKNISNKMIVILSIIILILIAIIIIQFLFYHFNKKCTNTIDYQSLIDQKIDNTEDSSFIYEGYSLIIPDGYKVQEKDDYLILTNKNDKIQLIIMIHKNITYASILEEKEVLREKLGNVISYREETYKGVNMLVYHTIKNDVNVVEVLAGITQDDSIEVSYINYGEKTDTYIKEMIADLISSSKYSGNNSSTQEDSVIGEQPDFTI